MTSASCPTPTGLGDTEMYACVGKVHGGVCALTAVNEASVEKVKRKINNKAAFLLVCILLPLSEVIYLVQIKALHFSEEKSHKN
jgi:hypothetical protein